MSVDTYFLQSVGYHSHVSAERIGHIGVRSYIGEHHVALVSIDTSTSALAAVSLYAVLDTVFYIYLVLRNLIASEYYGGLHLPHEEAIVLM